MRVTDLKFGMDVDGYNMQHFQRYIFDIRLLMFALRE